MSNIVPLVLFGGSFDPIHNGHLWMAHTVYQQFKGIGILPEIRFLPTACSPHKQTKTSIKHRLHMLKLALRDTPFHIDRTEIQSTTTHYTIDTLAKVRQKIDPHRAVIFIIGQDSLESLANWKGGYAILEMTHLWIFPRTHDVLADHLNLPNEIRNKETSRIEDLTKTSNGLIFLDKNRPPPLSSSSIRIHTTSLDHSRLLKKTLPQRVLAYNRKSKIY
jgi:nicotinate-nucleotide adenylyltransferase